MVHTIHVIPGIGLVKMLKILLVRKIGIDEPSGFILVVSRKSHVGSC